MAKISSIVGSPGCIQWNGEPSISRTRMVLDGSSVISEGFRPTPPGHAVCGPTTATKLLFLVAQPSPLGAPPEVSTAVVTIDRGVVGMVPRHAEVDRREEARLIPEWKDGDPPAMQRIAEGILRGERGREAAVFRRVIRQRQADLLQLSRAIGRPGSLPGAIHQPDQQKERSDENDRNHHPANRESGHRMKTLLRILPGSDVGDDLLPLAVEESGLTLRLPNLERFGKLAAIEMS